MGVDADRDAAATVLAALTPPDVHSRARTGRILIKLLMRAGDSCGSATTAVCVCVCVCVCVDV